METVSRRPPDNMHTPLVPRVGFQNRHQQQHHREDVLVMYLRILTIRGVEGDHMDMCVVSCCFKYVYRRVFDRLQTCLVVRTASSATVLLVWFA